MKKILKALLIFVLSIIVLAGLGLGYLTITDYQPAEMESIEVNNSVDIKLQKDKVITLYTWNIGYASLGAAEDFFMDDGVKALPENKEIVEKYMQGITNTIQSFDADFILIQEIDVEAKRSYFVDEKALIDHKLNEYSNSFALNYNVKYVPVPIPPMGKVEAGIGTYGKYYISDVTRYALPGQYSWPTRVAMLDRCMLVSRIPIEGSEGDLVLANAHFSAYDDGSIREQQLAFIKEFVVEEYEKGNYVVLGGDWNQTFATVDSEEFPLYKEGTFWLPYKIPSDWLTNDWTFGIGDNTPTYRLLNAPYEEGITQVGVIDGFLVSPNVKLLESEVINLSFENSDHNPVRISIELLD